MTQPSFRHPGRWIWFFLLVPVGLGLLRLHFDLEVFDLLPPDLRVVQGLKLYQQHFANARQLIILVEAGEADQADVAANRIAERLSRQTNLIAAVTWQPPWQEHPEQAAELIAYLWFNQPPGTFAELTNQLAPANLAPTLAAVRDELATSLSPSEIARLSYDPFGLTRLPGSAAGAAPSFDQAQALFSSADGKLRILFVQARQELRSYRDCERWLAEVRVAVVGALGGVNPGGPAPAIGYTGRPALVAETATGMQHDMVISVGGTAAIIAVLFWMAHRRLKPMLWLLALLGLILGATLALGGLIFGAINVVSMGFAAILLGLAVDYAVVHYQEALAHPDLSIPQIRHAIAPSIFWAAVTTIAAFLVLNLAGLPGLGQLGTLVALGVALAATIMIFEYLPPLFPARTETGASSRPEARSNGSERPEGSPLSSSGGEGLGERRSLETRPAPMITTPLYSRAVFNLTISLLLFTSLILVLRGTPPVDPTANALRPSRSPASTALEEIQATLNQKGQPAWVIVSGSSVTDLGRHLDEVQSVLSRGVTNHLITGFALPFALWPRPEFQEDNRPIARQLAAERDTLRPAAEAGGFAPASLALTERILDTWRIAGATTGIFWPTNPVSQWVLDKVFAQASTNSFAMGIVNTDASASPSAGLYQLQQELPACAWLSGWELLGSAIFARVHDNMWKVIGPMVFLVLLSLWLAFRRWPEILLSLAALLLSGLCLVTVMRLAQWSWNLMNLMAIPLMLGTGVDYSIFMQLALRRFHGDVREAYHSVGRALLLCGGTAIAAFGSLGLSSNAGMASLGRVCAIGIGWNVFIAIFLLPVWWRAAAGRTAEARR
jgi:predicted RND superfamily exporter protein